VVVLPEQIPVGFVELIANAVVLAKVVTEVDADAVQPFDAVPVTA
jgi:hypothetical protein